MTSDALNQFVYCKFKFLALVPFNLHPPLCSSLSTLSLAPSLPPVLPIDQRLNLAKNNPDDEDMIRGQLICESHVCPARQLAAHEIISGLALLMDRVSIAGIASWKCRPLQQQSFFCLGVALMEWNACLYI